MQHGKAPVALHHLTHAALTDPGGIRPRPVSDGSSQCDHTPVKIVIHDNGQAIELDATAWYLVPHVVANSDSERKLPSGESIPVGPEQMPKLVLHARLPKDTQLSQRPPEPPQEEPVQLDPVPEPLTNIPELAAVDPGVFATDFDRIAKSHRRVFTKPVIGSSAWEAWNKEHNEGE